MLDRRIRFVYFRWKNV